MVWDQTVYGVLVLLQDLLVCMNVLTDNGFLPKELFSKKGNTAEDAKFDKTITDNLSRQARHIMAVVSVDAAPCYDRVSHVIMVLV